MPRGRSHAFPEFPLRAFVCFYTLASIKATIGPRKIDARDLYQHLAFSPRPGNCGAYLHVRRDEMEAATPVAELVNALAGDNEITPIVRLIIWACGILLVLCFLGGCCVGCLQLRDSGYINLDDERANKLRAAQRAADEEVDRREAELARLRAGLAIADQADDEDANAARAAAQARYERAEKMLAFTRKEAAKRAGEYRAAVQDMLRLPDLTEMENGERIQTHVPIKPTIPVFAKATEGTRNAVSGVYDPGRVIVPRSPPVSARPRGPDGTGLSELGWGGNLYLLPGVLENHEEKEKLDPQQLGKMTFAARLSSWVHPSSPDPAPPSAYVVGRPKSPSHSYAQEGVFPPLHKKQPLSSEPSPPADEKPAAGKGGRSFFSARSYGGIKEKRPASPKKDRAASPKGPSVPRKVFAALSPKVSSFSRDRSAEPKRAGNILGTISLKKDALDTLPEQIRMALHKRHVRVIDLFRQLDVDGSGSVSMVEFVKAMREIGLQAPTDSIAAVFHSFDPDHSGSIEYQELHNLLVRSVQKHPRLEPLKTKAETSVPLRKQAVNKSDANVLGDVGKKAMAELSKEAPLDETVPNLIRSVLQAKLVRVIDLFRQLDDDGAFWRHECARGSFDSFFSPLACIPSIPRCLPTESHRSKRQGLGIRVHQGHEGVWH